MIFVQKTRTFNVDEIDYFLYISMFITICFIVSFSQLYDVMTSRFWKLAGIVIMKCNQNTRVYFLAIQLICGTFCLVRKTIQILVVYNIE